MEKKEPIKLKLSTVLLIIAVVVIIAIGVIIGIMYKQGITKGNDVPNTENVMLEENENAVNNNSNTEKMFSETEIKDKFQNFLNLFGAYQGSPYSVLYKMKEITGNNVINEEYPEAIEYGEDSILPTNIKYSEFKEFMLNYVTEEFFNTDFASGYVNKDGDLYCKTFGATGVEYEVKSIKKENNSNTKYRAKVDMIYVNENKEETDILFEIKNNNDKCVISSITLPSENMEDVEENDIDELDDKNENVTETITSNNITDSNQNNNNTHNTIKYADITKELEGIDVLYVTDVEKIDSEYILKGVIYTEYTISKDELNRIVSKGKMTLDGKEYTLKKVKNEEELKANSIYGLSDGYRYIAKKENSNLYYLYSITQISDVWKLTNDYRQIKVSENLIVVDDYTEEKTTVKKEFNNFKNSKKAKNETNPSPAYKFEFKNGKCTKIIRATTTI